MDRKLTQDKNKKKKNGTTRFNLTNTSEKNFTLLFFSILTIAALLDPPFFIRFVLLSSGPSDMGKVGFSRLTNFRSFHQALVFCLLR